MSHELMARLALKKEGFRFTHSLGQNFLLSDEVIARIADAAAVQSQDNILEIGPGAGVLTAEMLERGAKVLALELDKALAPVLQQVAPQAQVVFEDALKADIPALARQAFGQAPFRVVANLPYYITAQMLTRLTRQQMPISDIVVMVQKEAAQRVMAAPGEKAYCLLAATVQYFGMPQVLFEVGPEAFTPRPHVTSALMHIRRHEEKPVKALNEEMLHRVMAACFAMRRKTLINNLCAAFSLSREQASALLTGCGLDERVRGEALTLSQMGAVADGLTRLGVHQARN